MHTPHSSPQHGRHPLPTDGQEATIVYMPHCPRTLYHNVLASNWSPEQLGRVVLIANELDGYVTRCAAPAIFSPDLAARP